MEVHFTAEIEKELNDLALHAGVSANELVKEVVAGYIDGLSELRSKLDGRYDDLKSGGVEPIEGEAFFEALRAREEKLLRDKAS